MLNVHVECHGCEHRYQSIDKILILRDDFNGYQRL
jgi:hypothetical protein